MQTIFNDFQGLYSLSKTLRFELKPVGKTKELLEDFYNHSEGNPIVIDKQRIGQYPKMKIMLDDYYRFFIDKILSQQIFSAEELQSTYELYGAAKDKNKNSHKDYLAAKKALRKKLAKCFKDHKEEYGLNKYSKLFGQEQMPLNRWLQCKLKNGHISDAEYEESLTALKAFERFTTYFTGFKENRDNLFVEDNKATSIANRVIEENMEKHFFNCRALAATLEQQPQLADRLADFLPLFKPEYYCKCLNQQGIDGYNAAIGRNAEDEGAKGINQALNEYKQKNNLKAKDVPKLTPLFKQLLSCKDEGFVIETLASDKEMLRLAKYCYDKAQPRLNELQITMNDYLIEENLEHIYLKKTALNSLSQSLFAEWDIIRNALFFHCQHLTKKEQTAFEKHNKELISLALLQKIINNYLSLQDNRHKACDLALYFKSCNLRPLQEAYCAAAPVLALQTLNEDKSLPNDTNEEGGLGYRQTMAVKNLLDEIIKAKDFYKPFLLEQDRKPIKADDNNEPFYTQFVCAFYELETLCKKYNLIRNYVTQKPVSTEKFKLNFNNCTLLNGWDLNKEEENTNVLLRKNDQYYLGILKNHKLFAEPDKYLCDDSAEHYQKMVYKQV